VWIFHPDGFCSVVIDRQRPGNLHCRGRVKGDLEKLFPEFKKDVTVSPERDYRFRLSVPRTYVAQKMREAVEFIDYDNFKHACPPDRQSPYLRVWNVMFNLQDERAPRRRLPAVGATKKGKRGKKRRAIRIDEVQTDADYYEWLAAQPTTDTFSDPEREEAEAFFRQQELWR
jgi:hypothetical protein